jgi:hypothetical protein
VKNCQEIANGLSQICDWPIAHYNFVILHYSLYK